MNLILILSGFIVLGVMLFIVATVISNQNASDTKEEKLPYKLKAKFFTRSEWEFFKILEEQIDHTRFTIFTKVRLGDFIEVDAPAGERVPHWNRIKSKHIDFLIYDIQKSSLITAIELDGKSHNSERMQKSDDFKDKLYPTIGLNLVRVKVGTNFAVEVQSILTRIM